jgi:type I restriction enzyme S subunit
MGSEPLWPAVPLGAVAAVVCGGTPSTAVREYWEPAEVGWVTAKDISETRQAKIHKTQRSISRRGLSESSAKMLPALATVIIARGATMGQVRMTARPMALNQTCYGLVADGRALDSRYLYYYLSCQHERFRNMAHGSVFDTVIGSGLRSLDIPLPPVVEQQAIGRVLGTLDDKIELNRRMNETLEAMARALFRSWFVDFDPVIDNALRAGNHIPDGFADRAAARREALDAGNPIVPDHIARLFSDSFQDSELGTIPSSWAAGRVSDVATLARDTVKPAESPTEVFAHYSIPAFDAGRQPRLEPGSEIKSNKFAVPNGCVLLSRLNPRIPRVWLPRPAEHERAVCSTEFAVARPSATTAEFLYCLFSSEPFLASLATRVTGTSGSHQRVKPGSLLRMSVLRPVKPCVEAFTTSVSQVLAEAETNRVEWQLLAALRDALLPKLLSAELRLHEGTEREVDAGQSAGLGTTA